MAGWKLIPFRMEGDILVADRENQPKRDGDYLCTCVNNFGTNREFRYMAMVHYDKKHNHWHNIGNPSAMSHTILAWYEGLRICAVRSGRFKSECGYIVDTMAGNTRRKKRLP